MIFNMSGGGGAGLNFKVVGGPSQRTKPESPSLNMIWVDTETDISSWMISIARPTDPEQGMIWISTGKFNNYLFDALKKNSIQINPNGIYQYVDEAWVDVYAEIYNGEEWSPMKFDLWLIKDGVFNHDDFGDYTKDSVVTITSAGIYFQAVSNFATSSNKLFDFSKYATIAYDVTQHSYGNVYFNLVDQSGTTVLGSVNLPLTDGDQTYTDTRSFECDLRPYAERLANKPCYIKINSTGGNTNNYNRLNNIRFIPA